MSSQDAPADRPEPPGHFAAATAATDRARAEAEVWRLVFYYTLAGLLWIALSDSVVSALLADPALRAVAAAVKGWLFVGCTALLLHVVLMRGVDRRCRAMEREEQARQAQDRAHALLRDVLARIGDGFAVLDNDWRFTYVNAKGAAVLGHADPQALLGRVFWTEFPGIEGSSFQRMLLQSLQAQRPAVREDFYAKWNRWFECRVYPSPHGVSVYFSDITARHASAQALQRSELRYRLASRHGQVWDWSADTGQLVVAADFWQSIGMSTPPDDRSREAFEQLLHPDDLGRFRQALTDHLRQRADYGLEFRMRHADGGWRWFQTQGQAMWDAQGRAIYMAGTTFDITERKQAEQALRESEAYRRLVFEQLADGVLLVDQTLKVLDANAQALALFGYSRGELLCLSLDALLAEHERSRLPAELGRLLSDQSQLDEWEHLRRDGTRFPAEVSMRSLDGHRHVLVLRDIRVRRASERALLTYQLELSELTRRLLAQEKLTTQRVAQSLHDHVGQTLAVMRLNLEAAHATFGATLPPGMVRACTGIGQLLDQAVREVRHVLADLRPPMLETQELVAALDNEIRSRAVPLDGCHTGPGADVLIEASDAAHALRWPSDVEYGVFMVAREAVANARQHAQASLIRVLLDADTSGLTLEVIDDGLGVPQPLRQGRPGHLGIVGMRERAIAIGARFTVDSTADGGTRVHLRWEGAPT
ncbi:PAS domain S-box protein [Sphaerotilus sp.]|uniref:PAS domain-containing sensor histidine kinase n=1 Tax=Sphaerotilus sp. TaxID=2093942 RepID=UPI002ACEBE30|nr:PAS domain S-box protein [Sphaerotilus sp.]MDZ7855423.1 PAS domain S-box protein [Sphaerotilus sp.]